MSRSKKVFIAVLSLICFISGVVSVSDYLSKKQAEADYEMLRESVSLTTETLASTKPTVKETRAQELVQTTSEPENVPQPESETEANSNKKMLQGLQNLMKQNNFVVGWIKISDTKIDYPIMQNRDDNEYFLHRDINGKESYPGSIYLDSNHRINEDGLHVIYGHNMKNGSMFKDVTKFTDPKYMKNHQDVVIYAGEKEIHLKPVYCYAAPADGSYRNVLNSPEELESFLYEKTGQKISGNIFVLITCSYGEKDERTYCILKEEG